jgi:MFS family permease
LLLRERLETTLEQANDRLITPVFLLITLSTFAYFMSVGALIPILPRFVEGRLGGGNVAVGLVVGSFSIAAVILRPYAGSLSDRRGRRVLIVGGGAIVGVTTLCILFVESLVPLVLLRAVTGLGEAFFYVGAASAINDLAPDSRRAEALSFFSLALYLGLALGPVVGELTLDVADYSLVWIVAAAFSIVAGLLAISVPETRVTEERPPTRFINPAGLVPGVVLASGIWGLAGFNSFVPLYALKLGLSGSRMIFVLFSGIVLALRLFGARLPDRIGHVKMARIALGLDVVGLGTIGVWGSPAGLFVGATVFAVGQAFLFPSLMSIAIGDTPPAERGSVVGTFTAFFDLAFGLGAVTLGAISEALGFSGLFLSAAGIAAVGSLLLAKNGGRDVVGFGRSRVEESCEPY